MTTNFCFRVVVLAYAMRRGFIWRSAPGIEPAGTSGSTLNCLKQRWNGPSRRVYLVEELFVFKPIVLAVTVLMILQIAARSETPPTLPGWELTTPPMTDGDPGPGLRVRQTAPEYAGTDVHHALYLPVDWERGNVYPVIVEYTGNYFPPSNSSGKVADANLGYGMSGGRGFIWVAMPYVELGGAENAVTWWGDIDATVVYCKTNLPRICEQFGGDRSNVFVCGFSRGAIGASYIGLADDEIASFWKGVFTHDHFDGAKTWNYPASDRASALERLARLRGRPVLVCSMNLPSLQDEYLNEYLGLARFTFLSVPTDRIFAIPEGPVIHPHTDLWMHKESPERERAREWIRSVIDE